jgi:hypothetical protein
MRGKWFKALKRFIELFTPGGTEYTRSGIAVIFSRDGSTRIPESEYKKLILNCLDESARASARLHQRPGQGGAN